MEEDLDFEDYIILETVGKGCGSNTVYKVKNLVENKTYALKKMLIDIKDKEQNKKYSNEIAIFKSLNFPYIIRYYDSFIKNPYLCILMEYAPGGDLQHVINHHAKMQKEIKEQLVSKVLLI